MKKSVFFWVVSEWNRIYRIEISHACNLIWTVREARLPEPVTAVTAEVDDAGWSTVDELVAVTLTVDRDVASKTKV